MSGVNTRLWPRPLGGRVNTPAPPPLGQLPPPPRAAPRDGFYCGPTPPPFLGAGRRNSQPVESTAPSRVNVEGGSGSPTPGAPGPRGVRSAARGLEAAGCRDLKWCPGVGAGELGQAGAEPAPRLGAGQRPGPDGTQARAPGRDAPSDSSPVSREPRESAGAGGCAAQGGREVGVGTDPGWRAASQAETVPSPLSFHASPTPV